MRELKIGEVWTYRWPDGSLLRFRVDGWSSSAVEGTALDEFKGYDNNIRVGTGFTLFLDSTDNFRRDETYKVKQILSHYEV